MLLFAAQEEPIFHLPFQMLTLICDVDKLFTQWRYRHAIMVHGCVRAIVVLHTLNQLSLQHYTTPTVYMSSKLRNGAL